MADLARAEELVQTMERDGALRAAVEAAPTVAAKRQLLDAHGFGDVGLDDVKAWVASKGGTLVLQQGDRELSDEELAAVAAGGDIFGTEGVPPDVLIIGTGAAVAGGVVFAVAIAAA